MGRAAPALHSALFENYYRGKVVSEDEWGVFVEALRKPLPVTFRFVSSHALSNMAQARFREVMAPIDDLAGQEYDGQPMGKYRPLDWYPDEQAWELDFSKIALRKHELLKQVHSFLKQGTSLGTIIRQEAVSMIPVLCLTPGREHAVLDACAAPGTKTLQLIDVVGHDSLVVANELDGRRCCMLAHIAQKARHPGLLIANHDATEVLPLPMFDRVLCDVPCSGDGTLRKAPQLWSAWKPNRGIYFHTLQLRIALNAARHLKAGGRMVYSTCSLNPLENEAVVQTLVASKALRVVDPPFRRGRAGMQSWSVLSGTRQSAGKDAIKSHDVALAKGLTHLVSTLWPTGADIGLEKTMRVFPHDDNTGGFFVALLERTENEFPVIEIPKAEELGGLLEEEKEEVFELPSNMTNAPFIQVTSDSSERSTQLLATVREFYGLKDSFPYDCLFTRSTHTGRQVYLVSSPVRDVLLKQTPNAVIAGVRVFEENRRFVKTDCAFRLTQEGIAALMPYLGKRVIDVDPNVLYQWLKKGTEGILDVTKASPPIEHVAFRENWPQGSVVVSAECRGCQFLAVAEKGTWSLRPFVNKEELAELVRNLEFAFG